MTEQCDLQGQPHEPEDNCFECMQQGMKGCRHDFGYEVCCGICGDFFPVYGDFV